jgi:hypothetical protein
MFLNWGFSQTSFLESGGSNAAQNNDTYSGPTHPRYLIAKQKQTKQG